SDESYDADDIVDASLELWRDGGALYAFPFSNSPYAVFVNTDIVAAASAASPVDLFESGQWTWDAARETATSVATATDADGLVVQDFEYRDWNRLSQIWSSWGAAPWSADGGTCTFDSPQMVDAITWIHDAIFIDGAM